MRPRRARSGIAELARIDRRERGQRVEGLALEHLSAQGLSLLARNYRCRMGEIDLVMRDGAQLVFVEVRYRRDDRFGGPAASVDRDKRRRIGLTASHYLASHRQHEAPACRFDVVAVSGPLDSPMISWLRGAFDVAD